MRKTVRREDSHLFKSKREGQIRMQKQHQSKYFKQNLIYVVFPVFPERFTMIASAVHLHRISDDELVKLFDQ